MNLTQEQLERISAYLDDEMSPVERKRFEAEMRDYPDIKKKIAEFRELEKTLEMLDPLPEDAGFTNRLMNQLNKPQNTLHLKRWHSAAVAAILIGVFTLGIWNIDNSAPKSMVSEASIVDGLRPILASNILSKEDVFNFALYQTLPIDSQREQVLKLGMNDDGGEYITIRKVKKPLSQTNLRRFKDALTLNKRDEKRLDSMLQTYLETLAKDALLSRGNTMALNAGLWNYNRALVADVLAFAEKANPEAFHRVLPASLGNDYYASLRSYCNTSHRTLEDTFIIISSGSNFTDPVVIDLGKMQSRLDSTDDQVVKLTLFMKEGRRKGSNDLFSEYSIDTLVGNQVGIKIDKGIYHIRVPMARSVNISIPDMDSNFQVYFNRAANHLKAFSNAGKAYKAYQLFLDNYSGTCPTCGDANCRQCKLSFTDTGLVFSTNHQKPYLGVFIRELSSKNAAELGLKSADGIFIDGLMKNGGAKKAGMLQGDVIVKIDKQDVANIKELRAVIRKYKAGETLKVQVLRNRKKVELDVTLQIHDEFHSFAFPTPNINVTVPNFTIPNINIPPIVIPDFPVVDMNEMKEDYEELQREMDELKEEMKEMQKQLREQLREQLEDLEPSEQEKDEGGEDIGWYERVHISVV